MTPLGALSIILKEKLQYKIGFANGCFDLLHDGHLHLLKSAHKHCDAVFVGINDDASVKRLKGKERPVNNLHKRMKDLEKTGLCEAIVPFNTEDDLFSIITEVKPDFLIKGSDYGGIEITGKEFVRNYGGAVMYIPLLPGISTTKLLS